MFKKVVSHLPFSPSVSGEVLKLQRSLEHKSRLLGLAFFGMVLLLVLQLFITIAPPQESLQSDAANDIITGGIPLDANQLDAQSFIIKNLEQRRTAAAFTAVNITKEDILNATLSTVDGASSGLFVLGGERKANYPETTYAVDGFTFFDRPLKDSLKNPNKPVRTLTGTRSQATGDQNPWFAIALHSGSPIIKKGNEAAIELTQFHPKQNGSDTFMLTTVISNNNEQLALFPELSITIPEGTSYDSHYPQDFFNTAPKNKNNTLTFTSSSKDINNALGGATSIAVQVLLTVDDNNAETMCTKARLSYFDNTKTTKELCSAFAGSAKAAAVLGASCSIDDLGACRVDQKNVTAQIDAFNTTKNAPADAVTAQPGDEIEYFIAVTNNANTAIEAFIPEVPLTDALEYATPTTISDEGRFGNGGTVARWPTTDILPKQTITRSYTMRINPVPTTPVSTTDADSYDLMLTTVFGNKTSVSVEAPFAKQLEAASTSLPVIAPGTLLGVTTSTTLISGFLYVRSWLLAKELGIIRKNFNI